MVAYQVIEEKRSSEFEPDCSMPRAVEVRVLKKYSIHVVFSDGVEGTVDLGHLAHKGVFQRWDTDDLFAQVHIDEYGAIAWNDEIDICPDSVWLQLSNLTFEQWQQQNRRVHATNQ
jgi:hypothetical protein